MDASLAVPADDDLASFHGVLPSAPAESLPPEAEESDALGALARVGGRHASETEGEARLDLGQLVVSAQQSLPLSAGAERSASSESALSQAFAPAAQPLRAGWLVPLLSGIVIGSGLTSGAFLFMGAGKPETTQLAASSAPAPALPTAMGAPSEPAVAAAPEPAVATPGPLAQTPVLAAAAPNNAAAGSAAHKAVPRVATATTTPVAVPSNTPAAAPAAEPTPAAAQAPEPAIPGDETEASADAKASRNMDELLDDALSAPARKNELERQRALAAEPQKLPPTPSRDDVTQAMTVLFPAIRGCALGQSGTAVAAVVVRGDGRVASAEISGAPFAGTASGRCMEGVMRRARFPRFSQPIFRVRFPLAIQ